MERYRETRRVSLWAAGINFFLGLLKLLGGFFGGSTALMTDGIHSFSDIVADGFVIAAAKFGQHEADEDHPYGHRRIETLATVGVGMIILFLGLGMGYRAAIELWHHSVETPDFFTLIIAGISVLANEGLFFYTLKVGKKIRSELLIANAYHSRGDSLTSIVVFLSLIGTQLGWTFLDALGALVVAVYLMKMGVEWGLKAIYELVDAGLDAKTLREIVDTIHATPGVIHSHRLRTRKMAEQVFLDVHIQVSPYLSVSEGHYIGEAVRMRLSQSFPQLFDITVHVDIDEHPEGIPKNLPPSSETLARALIAKVPEISWEAVLNYRAHYFVNHQELDLTLALSLLEKYSASFLEEKCQAAGKALSGLQGLRIFYRSVPHSLYS